MTRREAPYFLGSVLVLLAPMAAAWVWVGLSPRAPRTEPGPPGAAPPSELTAAAAPAADAEPVAARSFRLAPDSRRSDDPCPCRLTGRVRGSD